MLKYPSHCNDERLWCIVNNRSHGVPISSRLYDVLRPTLRTLIPEDRRYHASFTRFEYLLFLRIADTRRDNNWPTVPVGLFAWEARQYANGLQHQVLAAFDSEVRRLGENWPYFKIGLFGKYPARYEAAAKRIADTIATF